MRSLPVWRGCSSGETLLIELRNISVRYPGATTDALQDMTCLLPSGSVTAVMGANGSGKSTLARTVAGLLPVTRGDLLLDDVSMTSPAAAPLLRRTVGMVFQRPHQQITSASVEREIAFGLENLGIPGTEMRRRVEEYLVAFDLVGLRNELPVRLAGGELQRLAVASVLILQPRYLVLDEPTSYLSPPSRRTVLDLAARHRREHDTGLLILTQFPEEAMEADHLLILHGGRVVSEGRPEHVLADAASLTRWGVRRPRAMVGTAHR
jgi:energy-coupling factor transport system ATP-binding protein